MVQKNFVIIFFILLYTILGWVYICDSSRNIIFMDYWRYVNILIPPIKDGCFDYILLFTPNIGQSNFLSMFLVAFNIKYTNLNCLWEEYAGIIVISMTVVTLYWYLKNVVIQTREGQKLQIMFVPIIGVLFSLTQWEILSLEFSFPFMIRIFSYYLAFLLFDYSLKKNNYLLFFGVGIYIGFLIVFLSQLYWVALIMAILLVHIYHSCKMKIIDIKQIFLLWCPIIIAVCIYFYIINVLFIYTNNSGLPANVFSLLSSIPVGVLYMLDGSIVHQSILENLSSMVLIGVGVFLLFLCVFPLYMYIKSKTYLHTYLPLLIWSYGMFSILAIVSGRGNKFGLFYLTSSRYSCDTSFVWVGAIMMLICMTQINKIDKSLFNLLSILKFWMIAICIFIITICSNIVEMKIAPCRGIYKDECLNMILTYNQGNYSDDELKLLQGGVSEVKKGIYYLKKYSLNVFKDH